LNVNMAADMQNEEQTVQKSSFHVRRKARIMFEYLSVVTLDS